MKPLKIGVTGGIGSGKSRVCTIFASLGYAIYDADSRARSLMVENETIVAGLRDLFGADAYLPDGSLNRALIGGIVFDNPEKLRKLNALVHPQTRRDAEQWYQLQRPGYARPFMLKEAAIMYESGTYQDLDGVITVYAPKTVRLNRVMKRDGVEEEAVLKRMDKQWADAEKVRRANFVIYNDGTHSLTRQVRAAIQFFKPVDLRSGDREFRSSGSGE